LDLLRRIATLLHADDLAQILNFVRWQSGQANTFVHDVNGARIFFNANTDGYDQILRQHVEVVDCTTLDAFEEFVLQRICFGQDLNSNFVQFDHIQPLKRPKQRSVI
jgi:hypothetical protein